jgi:hypothetical protein
MDLKQNSLANSKGFLGFITNSEKVPRKINNDFVKGNYFFNNGPNFLAFFKTSKVGLHVLRSNSSTTEIFLKMTGVI